MTFIDPRTLPPEELAIYRAGQAHDDYALNEARWRAWWIGVACGAVLGAAVLLVIWRG